MSSRVTMRQRSRRGDIVAQGAQVLALLALLIGVEARLLELVVGDGVLHAMHDELDAFLHLGELFGQELAQLDARSGSSMRSMALSAGSGLDVSARVSHGKSDRILGVGDGVKFSYFS